MRLIDSHFHWYPRSFLEEMRGRAQYPRVERDGDGYVCWYNEGGSRIALSSEWFDLERGLAVTEETGYETTVVCTTGVLSGLNDQASLADSIDIAVRYNEEVAAAQRRHKGTFYGTACVPLQDTQEAIRVTDYAVKELNLRGVNLPPVTKKEEVDVPRLEPFYGRVEELGVPLIIHPTDIAYDDVLKGHGGAFQRTVGRLLDSSMTVLRLIFSGILDRYPDLKIIHTHAGGLLPYQAGRIDKNARIAGLRRRPSEYLANILVDTVAPQALTIRTAIEFYGAENVLYGTDYPCWSPSAALEVLADAKLDTEQTKMLLTKNAGRSLNLGE